MLMIMDTLQIQPDSTWIWAAWRHTIQQSPLFAGLDDHVLDQALLSLSARIREYRQDEMILRTGDAVGWMGLLLSGTIEVTRQDGLGNVFIVTRLQPPSLFAEALVSAGISASPVDIRVTESATALLLDYSRLVAIDQDHVWPGRLLLITRMMQVLSRKNLLLNQKLDIMSRRSTRAKVAAVLLIEVAEQGRRTVVLPYNRQQLADYLAVDRSALSRELSHMKKENLIDYHRQVFNVLDPAALASYV